MVYSIYQNRKRRFFFMDISMHQLPLIWLEAEAVKELFEIGRRKIISSQKNMACASGFLGCFACELYLKYLYGYYNIKKETSRTAFHKGHVLKDLFCSLPKELQNTIKTEVGFKPDFDNHLNNCSEGFVNWRYYFENIQPISESSSELPKPIRINMPFLSELCRSLGELSARCNNSNEYDFDSDGYQPIIFE